MEDDRGAPATDAWRLVPGQHPAVVLRSPNAIRNTIALVFDPLLVLVLAHQFVEADQVMLGIHTVDWVAFMMKRHNCAPAAEDMARFVIDFYGLQRA